MTTLYALSIKQPWAALLTTGRKTIEVRRWPTSRHGRILIHASRVPDERPEAWAHVSPQIQALAGVRGGILGVAELAQCIPYRTAEAFAADRDLHLNAPEWFQPPVLYGFRFQDAAVLPFRSYPGWMRFFPVEWPDPEQPPANA